MAAPRLRAWPLLASVALAASCLAIFAGGFRTRAQAEALAAARTQALRRGSLEAGTLVAAVEKFRVLPFVLTELPDVRTALVDRSVAAQKRLDATFATLAVQTGATVFYAVDRAGIARSASNAGTRDSFVGHDFRFRPYFVEATRSGASEYFARGSVTGRPGLFLARRVGTAATPPGVVVVKIEFGRLERLWRTPGQKSLVVDRDGLVVIGTDARLRGHPLSALPRTQGVATHGSGTSAPGDAGLRFDGRGSAIDADGARYLAVERPLPILGWRHVHLELVEPVIAAANGRARLATLVLAMVLAGLLALGAWGATRRQRMTLARRQLEEEVSRRTAEVTEAYERLQGESAERAKADSRYRAAREELAQANRLGSIGTITTSVAHEMNQPVTAIRFAAENGIQLLARGDGAQAGSNLALIVSLTQRIGTITGELLSYSRRGRSERSVTALDAILDAALMLIGDSFRRAGVTLDVARQAGGARLHASRIQIEQVLVNLLQNALDAVQDREDGHVRLTARSTADEVRLLVEDNGAGVPTDLVETIFQPFFTGKASGTGLGLGISRGIVQDHGGTLTVDASPLGGAAFCVTLPRRGGEGP